MSKFLKLSEEIFSFDPSTVDLSELMGAGGGEFSEKDKKDLQKATKMLKPMLKAATTIQKWRQRKNNFITKYGARLFDYGLMSLIGVTSIFIIILFSKLIA